MTTCSFTYSLNMTGPWNLNWYRDRGLLKNVWVTLKTENAADLRQMGIDEKYLIEEITDPYAGGRIDIRGDTESPYGDEYSVSPMRAEDWQAFNEWLGYLDTTYQWPYEQLIKTFEEQTGITIRWAK